MKKIYLTLFAVALAACGATKTPTQQALPKGIKLIEVVDKQDGDIVIPYSKYELENGLTVIIHEDHSDPLAHVDVTYHVGSAREELGKSGFAHFFEHMMFQGSENVDDEEHFKIVSEAGGTLNGTTNSDRTNYFQTVPVNQLEKMLWLEADRMGFLLDAVTQQKFEVQRETVKNERGQRVENRPYGRVGETTAQALYPVGHPYSWPVIGWMEDLNRADLNDVKNFFLRWYGPNNATLTIGGDVDQIETLKLVNKYFGSIPRGPEVSKPEKQPVTLDKDRYVSLEDNVHLPLLYVSYPTVYGRHQDEAAIDLLAEIIGGGKTSILHQSLIKSGIAVQQRASHPCQELACSFTLMALPNPRAGKTLADIETAMRDAFVAFEKRGVKDEDLIKAKAKHEARVINGLQAVAGKVSTLAANETFTGNPNYIVKDLERYSSVTKQDVMRVYNQYIKGKHAVFLSVVPKGQTQLVAKKDNFELPTVDLAKAAAEAKTVELAPRKAVDNFDRSKMPEAGVNPLVGLPEIWRSELKNGLKVLGANSSETPTTSIRIDIPTGHYAEATDKAGLAALTATLMAESTQKRSAEEMALEFEKLGSSVAIWAEDRNMSVYINALSKNIDQTLALAKEYMLEPAFSEDEFARVKAQRIQLIQQQLKDPSQQATNGWTKLLYGDSIAGLPAIGTAETVSNLTLEDVKQFYATHFKPAGGHITLVSDLTENALKSKLATLNDWQGKAPELQTKFAEKSYDANTVYLLNKDNAAQSVIRIGKHAIPRDMTGEFFKAGLMNFKLGGAFNSRINLNLREDKGYTYGARSYFWGDKFNGGYTATAQVRADVTDKSVAEFVKEITAYHQNGMTAEELDFMRKAIGQRDALKYETPRQKLGFMANILKYELQPDFVEVQAKIINSITLDELNALAKKYLDIKDMAMLVVGDANTLEPQFKAMGYKVKRIQ